MKKLLLFLLFALVLFLPNLPAQETPSPPAAADRDRPRPIRDVLPDHRKIDGLLTFYHRRERLYAEIKSSNLNTDYLIAIAVARGSGSTVIGGYTYQSGGSDWLWQFRKVNDTIQVVRRNIRFRADPGDAPMAKAVEVGFTDSILYSLPIVATGDGGGDVIDFGSIFMADLPRLGIGSFDRSRSTWGDIKGFQDNMEFRVNATYSGGGRSVSSMDPNSIGVTLHYSISKLPSGGYTPRVADQRIGYFTVSHKNFSRAAEDDHVIRYINRWNLQKADPSLALSPPKKPITFYIEKTVPIKYRLAVREGILEWNKAFEKIGIANAIQVIQQEDSATWDAEDINYNVIRWITSERTFAMGPSRVNPLTGEILDADIIIDAGWIMYWQDRFDYLIGDVMPSANKQNEDRLHPRLRDDDEDFQETINNYICEYAQGRAAHFALAALALALEDDEEGDSGDGSDEGKSEEKEEEKKKNENGEETPKENGEEPKEDEPKKEEPEEEPKPEVKKPTRQELLKEREEKLERMIYAGLKDLITHEVGHTLGLRHNFAASSWLTLDEINDPERSQEYGHTGSVMDYIAINIAPKGKPQGDYFMSGLGPYDYLAIEYGYKIIPGGTEGEKKELLKIASRQAEDGNFYATDEDLSFGIDPRNGTWDLGKHPLDYGQRSVDLYNQLLPEILERAIREDGRYRDVGKYYRLLVSQRTQANSVVMRNITGLYRNRDRKGDAGDRPPIQVVDAQTKRDSVKFLCENTFGADAFRIAPEIYNRFGQELWLGRDDMFERTAQTSLGDLISSIQCGMLESLLSVRVLDALSDTALRVPDSDDVYTIEELFSTIMVSVFSELDTVKEGEFSPRRPAIPMQRRTLQEHCFKLFASYAAGDSILSFMPDVYSSRALARYELTKLDAKIQATLTGAQNWDAGSVAHLTMLRDRIKKLLDANLLLGRP
ncbi:MAG: zinc-dependent metalloprotease [Planctomycetaceae bacterium]|nr:zinc-dependent metalloprotease [Planctomycetaceae bacterium]